MKNFAIAAAFMLSVSTAVLEANAQCITGCSSFQNTTITYRAGSLAGALGRSYGQFTRSTSDTFVSNGGDVTIQPNGRARGYVYSSAGAYQNNSAFSFRGTTMSTSMSGVTGGVNMTVNRSSGVTRNPPQPN